MRIRYWCPALSSMCCIPITVNSFCWGIFMSGRCSVMLCVVGGSADSGVGVKAISMPSLSMCCSRLGAQQFGVSFLGEV